MFKIEVTKLDGNVEHIYNMNLITDDFLQFIPKNFGVSKDNMKAYAMPDAWKDELEAYLKIEGNLLDVGQEGKLRVIKIDEVVDPVTEVIEEQVTVVKEYVGTLIEYPYIDGKFKVEMQAVV